MAFIPMHQKQKQEKKVVKLPKMSIKVLGGTTINMELVNKITLD